MTMLYPIVLETEDNGAVSAYVPGLPVYAAADTPRRPNARFAWSWLHTSMPTRRAVPKPECAWHASPTRANGRSRS